VNGFEVEILKNINSVFSSDFLDEVFVFISTIGNKGAIWIFLAILLMIFPKTRKWGICASISLIFCLIIGNGILKPVIGRCRPYNFDPTLNIIIHRLKDGSFPSGHTMAAFAFARAVSKNCRKCAPYLYTASTLMALSRIYLMMHYPTDVIGGAIFGIIFGELAFRIANKVLSERYEK